MGSRHSTCWARRRCLVEYSRRSSCCWNGSLKHLLFTMRTLYFCISHALNSKNHVMAFRHLKRDMISYMPIRSNVRRSASHVASHSVVLAQAIVCVCRGASKAPTCATSAFSVKRFPVLYEPTAYRESWSRVGVRTVRFVRENWRVGGFDDLRALLCCLHPQRLLFPCPLSRCHRVQ